MKIKPAINVAHQEYITINILFQETPKKAGYALVDFTTIMTVQSVLDAMDAGYALINIVDLTTMATVHIVLCADGQKVIHLHIPEYLMRSLLVLEDPMMKFQVLEDPMRNIQVLETSLRNMHSRIKKEMLLLKG